MSRMSHTNVASVVDFGSTEHGLNFLVMEHGHESYPTRCRYALEAPQPTGGAFPVTDDPGLGVRIDDKALERFSRPA